MYTSACSCLVRATTLARNAILRESEMRKDIKGVSYFCGVFPESQFYLDVVVDPDDPKQVKRFRVTVEEAE